MGKPTNCANDGIDRLGGNSRVAAFYGRTVSAVSHWRVRGIPRDLAKDFSVRLKGRYSPGQLSRAEKLEADRA